MKQKRGEGIVWDGTRKGEKDILHGIESGGCGMSPAEGTSGVKALRLGSLACFRNSKDNAMARLERDRESGRWWGRRENRAGRLLVNYTDSGCYLKWDGDGWRAFSTVITSSDICCGGVTLADEGSKSRSRSGGQEIAAEIQLICIQWLGRMVATEVVNMVWR